MDETPKSAKWWKKEIDLARKAEETWRKRARDIIERYRDDKEGKRSGKRFNVLWANTETLRPALYAKTAKPDVRRRFPDQNPVARQTAMVIERALAYCVDTYDLDRAMEATVQDMLLSGRGVAWLVYESEIATQQVPEVGIGEDGLPAISMIEREYVAKQTVRTEHVPWEDFLISPSRSWGEKRWIARRHKLARDELRREFPEFAEDIPLNWRPEGEQSRKEDDDRDMAELWEIWHQDSGKRIWIAEGFDKIVESEDDPYGLEAFYPVPDPLYGVPVQDSMVPIPEYTLYQDQARELDEITSRISSLIRALRRKGVYNSAVEGLKQLADAGDNVFVPVADFQGLMEKGGLAAQFQTEDLRPFAAVLTALYTQRTQIMNEIYEITGISELLRGVAQAGETATSARIRGSFGSLRLKDRQQKVQRFVRDLYRLKAELIAEHFEPPILSEMVQAEVPEEVTRMMRQDRLRSYNVDIETDSTVFEDAEEEKKAVSELLSSVSQFMQAWGPIVGAQPVLAPLSMEMLKMAVRRFKAGREIEEVLDKTARQLMQQAQQPKGPDPKQAEMQARMEMEKAKMSMQGQKMQVDMRAKQMGMMADAKNEQARMQTDAQLEAQKMTIDAELERRRQDQDFNLTVREQDLSHRVDIAKARAAKTAETRQ